MASHHDDDDERRRRVLEELLSAPLLSTPLLFSHVAGEEDQSDRLLHQQQQDEETAAAATLAAASLLADRARRHLGAGEGSSNRVPTLESQSAGASSCGDGSGEPLLPPPRKAISSLWARPPMSPRRPTSSEAAVLSPGLLPQQQPPTLRAHNSSQNLLVQLEAALGKAMQLGEGALDGVSTTVLESIHRTQEGLRKARAPPVACVFDARQRAAASVSSLTAPSWSKRP